jgi:hypothetical protein
MKEQNAIIKSADISNDDHGLLTAWIFLEYDSGGQGFGGCALYLPKSFKHHNTGGNFAGHWIWRVMEIAGVAHWKDLPGKSIRVRHDVKGESILGATIHSIGHIVKNDWFDPAKEFEELTAKQQ